MIDTKEKKQNRIAETELFIVACLSLLPTGGIFEYIKLGGVVVILAGMLLRGSLRINNRALTILLLIAIVSSIALITSVFNQSINNSQLSHELKRNGFLCGLIVVSSNLKVDFKSIYKVCVFFICINTFIQILEYMKVDAVFDFIETYYVTSGEESVHLQLARYHGFLNFRAGSIFLNPNVYMVVPLVSMSVFLQRSMFGASKFNKLMIAVTCVSIFLTGSRTAIIITFALLVIYVFHLKGKPTLKAALIGLVFLVLIAVAMLADTYRIFDVSSGIDGSLAFKIRRLGSYIDSMEPIALFFGSLGFGGIAKLDFELGYVFAYYGILGLVWFVLMVRYVRVGDRSYNYVSYSLKIILTLMACTAAILLCMPICTFFVSIAFAKITNESESFTIQNNR